MGKDMELKFVIPNRKETFNPITMVVDFLARLLFRLMVVGNITMKICFIVRHVFN